MGYLKVWSVTMPDPQPVLNWYRVLTFVVTVCSGLMLFTVIPQNIKDLLPIVTFVIGAGLTVFFKVGETAMPNPSIARRVVDKVSGGSQ